jgi:hypothetical protein
MNYRELQAECKRLGLSAKGKRKELEARLEGAIEAEIPAIVEESSEFPKFAYLGDHDGFTSWGISFPRGVAVEVRDGHAAAKCRGNSHFEER